jgi:hypothetical protein
MKQTSWIILGWIALIIVAHAGEISPIATGTVFNCMASDKATRALSSGQLQELTTWLKRSSANWGYCFATPPASCSQIVTANNADGKTFFLKLHSSPTGWKNTIETGHLDGSNLSDQPCALQKFSEHDMNELHSILGKEL